MVSINTRDINRSVSAMNGVINSVFWKFLLKKQQQKTTLFCGNCSSVVK
jgi:hypothetical protein